MLKHESRPTLRPDEAPDYFARIKDGASRRWNQLEADPELAGPWHQLFKQVQSPRHILSELLQNADDAGASEARVSIENNRFVFEHNGEDFIEAHFASICRFGYSNKRALHTIGFRGIGFKSTFSLGDRVELFTPTLAVAFERARFTEPHWVDGAKLTSGATRVEVTIADALLRREVEKNLDEWLQSPVSLLFFRKIRGLKIGDNVLHWQSLGPGPIAESEWMALDDKASEPFLLVRSLEEAFPDDALDEIRKERMLGTEEPGDFPPCRVEIVLGAKGRLYVVLPTGVETLLPFACNAPFIQDPARLKIKDPETSPTNRWLLDRAGRLAANAMLDWLEQTSCGVKDRADAYGWLPDVGREASSLEGTCAAIVELAFADQIADRPILLTDGGDIVAPNEALIVPLPVFDIWPAEQAMALLDEESRRALCRLVSAEDRRKLLHWDLIEEYTKDDLLDALRTCHLPRPASWRNLLSLWAYIAPEVTSWQCHDAEQLRIVPVQGKDVLYAAFEVVRLGEKKLLQSDEDWEFLSTQLVVLNQNWTRFLAEQRRDNSEERSESHSPAEAAFAVLEEIGLDETSDVSAVIERVAAEYFSAGQPKLVECVRLAQIAAKLGATIGDSFRYACNDRTLRSIASTVLFDENGSLEDLLPENNCQAKLLHTDYVAAFTSCTQEEWSRWVSSGRSGLQTFVPLIQKKNPIYGRSRIVGEAQGRGLSGSLYYPYVTNDFVIEDWDFPAECWKHWDFLSKSNDRVWVEITTRILEQKDNYWSRTANARFSQIATTGSTRSISSEPLRAAWLQKLRQRPCLPDTRDLTHFPTDLLRRTPETESLLDVEPFVHGLLDRETTRPLLDLLGVRSTPTGPGRLLERLRALAKSDKAPPHEVEKWYRRLDQMLDDCSTADTQTIKDAFKQEQLILAQDGTWATSEGVFLTGDEEDVPGAAVVKASVAELSLWRRIGVADRPTAELAMQWLGSIESGSALAPDNARRVRTLMIRYPMRIWEECAHWMNMLGEWVPIDELRYSLSMQSLFRWGHLHDWVKRKTADFQRLPTEILQTQPFVSLKPLSSLVEERFEQLPLFKGAEDRRDWLTAFGILARRIDLPSPEETDRVRQTANSIAKTIWVEAAKLEVVPYLEGVPAGTARLADILWLDDKLYVSPLSKAKLAKRVPEEIGKTLNSDIRAALAYAFERSPEDIKAYLEENFTLVPERDVEELTIDEEHPVAAAERDEARPEDEETGTDDVTALDGLGEDVIGDEPEDETISSSAVEQADGESEDELIAPQPEKKSRPPAAPRGPSLMTRFASSMGFKADGQDRYFHTDGSWISRSNGARFPWEHRTASGEVLRYYFPKEHCIKRDPLQIEADIWGLLEQKPILYAFVLIDTEGNPIEMTGERFRALREEGGISLHPATYRLVYSEAPA